VLASDNHFQSASSFEEAMTPTTERVDRRYSDDKASKGSS